MNDYTRVSRNKKEQIFRFCKTISKRLSTGNRKAKGYSFLHQTYCILFTLFPTIDHSPFGFNRIVGLVLLSKNGETQTFI